MADEVRRRINASETDARRAADELDRQWSAAKRVIASQIPEFIAAARELGIKPEKEKGGLSGLLSRPYWTVPAGGWWNDEWSRWDRSIWLKIYTDGSWEPRNSDDYTKRDSAGLTEEDVRAGFTWFLTRKANKPR